MDKLWHTLTQIFHRSIARFEQSIFMTWIRNVKEKEIVLSLELLLLRDVPSFLISCYQMVRVIGDCLSQRFSSGIISRSQVPDMSLDKLQLWNCFSYYPSVHRFDWMDGIDGKFRGKDKKFYPGTYLFTIDWGHPESNILNTWNILKYLKNISAHILFNLEMATMQLSLIIVVCGMLIVTLPIKIGQILKSKIRSGIAKMMHWVTEDSDNMFYELETNNASQDDKDTV